MREKEVKVKQLLDFFNEAGATEDTDVVFLKDETQEVHLCTMSILDKSKNMTVFFLVGTGNMMRPAGVDTSVDPSKLN